MERPRLRIPGLPYLIRNIPGRYLALGSQGYGALMYGTALSIALVAAIAPRINHTDPVFIFLKKLGGLLRIRLESYKNIAR